MKIMNAWCLLIFLKRCQDSSGEIACLIPRAMPCEGTPSNAEELVCHGFAAQTDGMSRSACH